MSPAPEAWLRLLAAAGPGNRRWLKALRAAGTADTLLGLSAAAQRRAGLEAAELAALQAPAEIERWRRWLDAPRHELIVFGSSRYPERLAEIPDPPLALWLNGERANLIAEPQLAIVGSRNPTRNGALTAEQLARELAELGIVITSGLALGIDAASHRGALGAAGTIAVLGSGIDQVYPQAHASLAREIGRRGLIVSEYAPGHGLSAWQFPRRNRIIAALTLGTLVIEATRRSGALITARRAADYGREVFAIPGSIHSTLSKGCHELIRNGAKLVDSIRDILVEIAPQLTPALDRDACEQTASAETELPAALNACLEFSPISFDELLAASGLTAGELSSMLLHLELQGKIEALPGGRYCRLAKRA